MEIGGRHLSEGGFHTFFLFQMSQLCQLKTTEHVQIKKQTTATLTAETRELDFALQQADFLIKSSK